MDKERRFSRHIRDVYERVDELASAAEAVQATLESAGWAHIEAVLNAELRGVDAELDDPQRVLEQAVYASKHAYRGGLKGARQAGETLIAMAIERLEQQRARHEDQVPAGAGTGG